MFNIALTLFAYLIDKKFGEFRFIKHPVIYIGELITFFENRFYKDDIFRGFLLTLFVVGVSVGLALFVEFLTTFLPIYLKLFVLSVLSSMFIAHHMLKSAVLGVVEADDKKKAISMLVSRDTQNLSESEIYKASVETYAENLSDGVVAPMFYLLLFGFSGIVFYKVINTLDSMVGYRNKKYENFGKVSAIADDVLNFIPSRITAVLIMLKGGQKNIFAFYKDGKKHKSPNAGHPITAMALVCNIQLGGDTSYFGKVEKKATFGDGNKDIKKNDVLKALKVM